MLPPYEGGAGSSPSLTFPILLKKQKNWHRNFVPRFKGRFCQWPVTLWEHSHQSSIATEDEMDFVSFFLSKLKHTRNFTGMKMMCDLPHYKSMGISIHT